MGTHIQALNTTPSLSKACPFPWQTHGGCWGIHRDLEWALSRYMYEMALGRCSKLYQ